MPNCSTINCNGQITQRGVILCNDCIEEKRKLSEIKKNQNNDELIEKLLTLQNKYNDMVKNYETKIELSGTDNSKVQQITNLKEKIEIENKNLSEYNIKLEKDNTDLLILKEKIEIENKNLSEYNIKLEKDNTDLTETNDELRKEILRLIQEKIEYEKNHNQLSLDIEKSLMENKRLLKINAELNDENKLLSPPKQIIETISALVKDEPSAEQNKAHNDLEKEQLKIEEKFVDGIINTVNKPKRISLVERNSKEVSNFKRTVERNVNSTPEQKKVLREMEGKS